MSRSHRRSEHFQPRGGSSDKLTGKLAPVTDVAALSATEAPEGGGLYGRLLWISILIWLTCFLGLTLTVWLDLIIGVINWEFFKRR